MDYDRSSSNSAVDRYRSPLSGSTQTISLPADSGRAATLSAADIAAPLLMPQVMPSSLRQPLRHLERFLVGDREDLVDQAGVEDIGDKAGADALDRVLARLAAGQHGTGLRLDRHDSERMVLFFLDVTADARERSARAHAGDEHVDLAIGVVPQFRPGGLEVDRRVGGILKLLRDEPAGLAGDLFGPGDGPLHAVRAGREDEFPRRIP